MGRHHARVYAELEQCELVGIVDPSERNRQSICDRFGCRSFESVDELLDAGVDAVSIAVPLAPDAESCARLKAVGDRTGSVLMVGHIERFNPIVRAMQSATADGTDIEPRFIQVHRVSPMTFRSVDISVVMDMMIHDLDVVLMLMGGQEPDEVHASGVAVVTDHEDLCNAWLVWRRPSGACVANLTASRLALKTERVTRITGENAYIKIDYASKQGIIIRRRANEIQMAEVREMLRSGTDLTDLDWHELVNVEPLVVDASEPLVMEIQSFLNAVRTGRRPDIDAEAGLANVRLAERILTAAKQTMAPHTPEVRIPKVGAEVTR